MKKILLVKTSSLGDVVHNLPVVSDIHQRFPQASVDWIVEEAYVPLVQLHPGIRRVIPVAFRRWRRKPLGRATWREIADYRRLLGSEHYDEVIDTQGLVKSAVLSSSASGRKHGFDAATAREPLAARFYDVVHHVSRTGHAVVRNRELVAAALGYRVRESSQYGIPARDSVRTDQVVFLHSTSRGDKHWNEAAWIELGKCIQRRGLRVVLPWGSESERNRSERIASAVAGAQVAPRLAISDVVDLLARARAVAGLDTGLTHLAAALGTPVAAIYCGSDPKLTGVHGATCATNLGGPGRSPTPEEVDRALGACGGL